MVETVSAATLPQGAGNGSAARTLEPGTELKARVERNLPGGVVRLATPEGRIDLRVSTPLPANANVTVTVTGSRQQPSIQITTDKPPAQTPPQTPPTNSSPAPSSPAGASQAPSSPTQPTPPQPAPAQPAPSQPAPTQPAPAQPAPVQSNPQPPQGAAPAQVQPGTFQGGAIPAGQGQAAGGAPVPAQPAGQPVLTAPPASAHLVQVLSASPQAPGGTVPQPSLVPSQTQASGQTPAQIPGQAPGQAPVQARPPAPAPLAGPAGPAAGAPPTQPALPQAAGSPPAGAGAPAAAGGPPQSSLSLPAGAPAAAAGPTGPLSQGVPGPAVPTGPSPGLAHPAGGGAGSAPAQALGTALPGGTAATNTLTNTPGQVLPTSPATSGGAGMPSGGAPLSGSGPAGQGGVPPSGGAPAGGAQAVQAGPLPPQSGQAAQSARPHGAQPVSGQAASPVSGAPVSSAPVSGAPVSGSSLSGPAGGALAGQGGAAGFPAAPSTGAASVAGPAAAGGPLPGSLPPAGAQPATPGAAKPASPQPTSLQATSQQATSLQGGPLAGGAAGLGTLGGPPPVRTVSAQPYQQLGGSLSAGAKLSPAPQPSGAAGATPAAQVARGVQVPLGEQQAGLTSLFAQIGSLMSAQGAGNVTLPDSVMKAMQQILGLRLTISGTPSASDLQQAVRQSGQFREAQLALPGTAGSPVPDLKSALLSFKSLLQHLGARPEIVRPAGQPAAPSRHGAPQGQAPQSASGYWTGAAPQNLQALLKETDAALARLRLTQLSNTGLARDSAPQLAGKPMDLVLELPLALGQETAVMQMQIGRDSPGNQTEEEGEPAWRLRFALDLTATGPLEAAISLRGGGTYASLWVDRKQTYDSLNAVRETMEAAFADAGLDLQELRLIRGLPPKTAAYYGAMVDRQS